MAGTSRGVKGIWRIPEGVSTQVVATLGEEDTTWCEDTRM